MKRAANNGLGGSTYGETSIFLTLDSTHYAELFIASGSLTAWLNTGGGESNITGGCSVAAGFDTGVLGNVAFTGDETICCTN